MQRGRDPGDCVGCLLHQVVMGPKDIVFNAPPHAPRLSLCPLSGIVGLHLQLWMQLPTPSEGSTLLDSFRCDQRSQGMSLVCLWTLSATLSPQRLRTDGTWGVCLGDEHALNHWQLHPEPPS